MSIQYTYCVHTAYILHTYCIHTAYILHTYCVHTAYILRTYCIHTAYILCTYCVHTAYILHTYCIHTAYILHTYCVHTAYILYTYCIHTVYILHTYCIHTAYILPAIGNKNRTLLKPASEATKRKKPSARCYRNNTGSQRKNTRIIPSAIPVLKPASGATKRKKDPSTEKIPKLPPKDPKQYRARYYRNKYRGPINTSAHAHDTSQTDGQVDGSSRRRVVASTGRRVDESSSR